MFFCGYCNSTVTRLMLKTIPCNPFISCLLMHFHLTFLTLHFVHVVCKRNIKMQICLLGQFNRKKYKIKQKDIQNTPTICIYVQSYKFTTIPNLNSCSQCKLHNLLFISKVQTLTDWKYPVHLILFLFLFIYLFFLRHSHTK